MKTINRALIASTVAFGMVFAAGIPSNAADCTPIARELANPKLGELYAYAVDLTTGKVLVSVRSNEQTPSASVMKTVTAAAAIKFVVKPREVAGSLPYRATTSVLTLPNEPGTLVLKGGGDHTLTRVNPGAYTTYFLPGAHPAKMRDLASAALAALPTGTVINKIILDDSFFQGPTWNPNWNVYSRIVGDMSPIAGLMIDGARYNPDLTDKNYNGKRVLDPTLQAGNNFKKWLGDAALKATVVKGKTPTTATLLTSKDSQPIENWIRHALKISDNTETEVIARHTEIAMGLPNKYNSVQLMGERLLKSLGVKPKKLIMNDASGLAPTNRVTAQILVAILKSAADPSSDLASLPTYMATSGDGGTLGGRFLVLNKSSGKYELVIPKGSIRAKTGFIGGLYSLAGTVYTADSHTIVFAMFAKANAKKKLRVGAGTKNAIDAVVNKLYLCGSAL